ncbi:type IV secretory system conjugative DNA transfer family protein [Rhodoplanes sp. SY1]|uniref:type IV secretory system conjugative DNA transfer family protein n=1 Tax=Rhodoplanes sp. SY1 TaxID=3166646 RepID=UPI0038B4B3E8
MQLLGWFLWLAWQPVVALWRLSTWLRPRIFGGRGPARRDGSHGTARWATVRDAGRAGLLRGSGPILGGVGLFGRLARFTTDGLMWVFAATGAGKGLGIVVPTLLSYPGSIVVTDPKGENYAVTRRERQRRGTVVMLNPSNLPASARFNPLDIIRKDSDLESADAVALARLMTKPEREPTHWDNKAASLLTALLLHTLHSEPPETRTLAHVRRLSVGGAHSFRETLQEIAGGSRSLYAREIAQGYLRQVPEDAGEEGEFSSILSTLDKATEIWSAGSPVGRLSEYSTFALTELVTSVTTLYLCLDEELLTVYDRWLRVMAGCVLNTLTRAKHLERPRHKVVLLLDEVAALGPLETLQNQSGLLRAYCTPVLIWQNLPQVRAVYGDGADAFLANASARVFFGVSDNQTAAYVAAMVGNATVLSHSQGQSQTADAWFATNRQEGLAESGYPLLDAAEAQALPLTEMVARVRGLAWPLRAHRLDYRRVIRWQGRWDAWSANAPPADGGAPAGAAAAPSAPRHGAAPGGIPVPPSPTSAPAQPPA